MKTHAKTVENQTVAKLLEACREYPGLDPRDPLEAIADPCWDDAMAGRLQRPAVPPAGDHLKSSTTSKRPRERLLNVWFWATALNAPELATWNGRRSRRQ
jgi:hypothetical protein